jgi:hypothetical protein
MFIPALAVLGMSLAAAPVEVGFGGGLATAARGERSALWNGAEPAWAARIFADDKYVQTRGEIALMPVVFATSPEPILLQGYNFAFTIQQTFLAGYRFHIDETWSVSPAAGVGANYHIDVSGDSGSGAPYVSGAAELVVTARVNEVFAVEGALVGSYGMTSVVRGSLVLSAVFRFE